MGTLNKKGKLAGKTKCSISASQLATKSSAKNTKSKAGSTLASKMCDKKKK